MTAARLLLDRHAGRRASGLPTVSVLVGPAGAGPREWRGWLGDCPTLTLAHSADAPARWAADLARRFDLPAAAVAALAARLGRDPVSFAAEWDARTPADVARFWDAIDPSAAPPALRAVATGGPLLPSGDPFPSLREAAGWLPADQLPAVMFVLSEPERQRGLSEEPRWRSGSDGHRDPESGAALASLAAGIVTWATGLPTVPTAVAVAPDEWAAFLASAPESRAKAVLRDGVIDIPTLDRPAVIQQLAAAGLGADAEPLATALAAAGATLDLVRDAADATGPDDAARSAAERLLFELLESIPETAGRFELNGTLDFHFGNRPCEVDLLARTDRLVIEIDGYHHFRDPDHYRRDRRKDWELQRRGFFVLRFLADDVARRVEQVRDRILDTLNRTSPEGSA